MPPIQYQLNRFEPGESPNNRFPQVFVTVKKDDQIVLKQVIMQQKSNYQPQNRPYPKAIDKIK